MKTMLVYADGHTREISPQSAQWLEHEDHLFFGTEAYDRDKPYRGVLVYVEVPRHIYEARKLDSTKDILRRWRRNS
jgi:hypothetical protein